MLHRFFVLCCVLVLSFTNVLAQCDMSGADGQNPNYEVDPDPTGEVTEITSDQTIGSEYSVLTDILTGHTYYLVHAHAGTYITVREGSVAGAVVAQGYTPLGYNAANSSNLYVHWSADENCDVNSLGSYLTTVQDLGIPCDMSLESGQYPFASITPDAQGGVTVITNTQYAGSEYSVLTGISGGNYYQLTHSAGSYISVRQGAITGIVIAEGYSPLQFTTYSGADIYVHWTVDDDCTVDASGVYTTTVQNLGTPPCNMSISNGGEGRYPFSSITPDGLGGVTEITNTQFAGGEFSQITGVEANVDYVFTHAAGAYITVRIGSAGGQLLGRGYSPLTVTATGTADFFVHWTTDEYCGQDPNGEYLTTVQAIGLPCNMSLAEGQFPADAVYPSSTGAVTTISDIQYGGAEYSVISGIQSGSDYEFTHSNGAYITVRVSNVTGPVLAAGYSPLIVTTTSYADLYVHWTVDEFCHTAANQLYLTTVQLLGVPCVLQAGSLTPDATPVALVAGVATVSATIANSPSIVFGYQVTYVLVDATGVVQQVSENSLFTVNTDGDYTIHTLIFDPLSLDPSTFVPGTTTLAQVNAMLLQGGGSICGALDLTGAAITVTPELVTGIAETLVPSLGIFPNPSNGQFTVQLNGVKGTATINIVDVMGRNVFTQALTLNGAFTQVINLNVAKGLYLLQVITDNAVVTRKLKLQ